MINEIFIAWRILRGKHSFGLVSYSSTLSIIGLAIGSASIILIAAFSEGFSSEVKLKLSSLDGHIRIEKFGGQSNSLISKEEILEINLKLKNIPEIRSINSYNQANGMYYKGTLSQGSLVFGINDSLLKNLTKTSKKINYLSQTWKDTVVILGSKLAASLNIKSGDSVYLFNLNSMINSKEINAVEVPVMGTIETGFLEYDKMLSFIPQKFFQSFFNQSDNSNGVIIDLYDYKSAGIVKTEIQNSLGMIPFITNTWLDRHEMLFSWMNYFHLPLQLLMVFISILAIFNIASILWMMILEKVKNIAVLKAMGFSDKMVIRLFLIMGILIGILGIFSGILLAFIILGLQDAFHFISLSSDVYFLEYLPVEYNIFNIILITLCGLLINSLFCILPVIRIKNIMPATVLRED